MSVDQKKEYVRTLASGRFTQRLRQPENPAYDIKKAEL